MTSDTTIKVRHILVDQEYEAKDIERKLAEGKTFEDMAMRFSKCGSASTGGDLGTIGRGRTVPSFEEAAFALKPGEVSAPVRSPFGYHLIKRYG